MASDLQVGSQFEDASLPRGRIIFMNDNKDAFDLWWEWAEKAAG
jgi:hypothetical protein